MSIKSIFQFQKINGSFAIRHGLIELMDTEFSILRACTTKKFVFYLYQGQGKSRGHFALCYTLYLFLFSGEKI